MLLEIGVDPQRVNWGLIGPFTHIHHIDYQGYFNCFTVSVEWLSLTFFAHYQQLCVLQRKNHLMRYKRRFYSDFISNILDNIYYDLNTHVREFIGIFDHTLLPIPSLSTNIIVMSVFIIWNIIIQNIWICIIIKIHHTSPMAAYDADPYFQGKLQQFQSNTLNFTSYASATNPDVYCFSGNAYSLNMKLQSSQPDQFSKCNSLRINLTGTIIKSNSMCCFWWTIIFGSILIFPFFFICCDWWKKIVNKLYNVENCGYDAVVNLLKVSNARELYLMVQDNLFNRQKAECLIQALSQSRIHNLVFNNVAGGFNCEGSNYSDFPNYMKPLKSSFIKSDISWGSQVVL